jgi:hypothetical protein
MTEARREALKKEAEIRARQLGISTEEFLETCLSLSRQIIEDIPTIYKSISQTESEIKKESQELQENIRKGAGRMNGNGSLFI